MGSMFENNAFVEYSNITQKKNLATKVTSGGDKISKWKESGFAPLLSKAQYICSLCTMYMLQSIVQTFRGSLACEDCYRQGLKTNPGFCPIDKQPIKEGEFFVDKAKEKEIGNTEIQCPHHQEGCTWKGCIRDFLREHQDRCEYEPTECQLCHEGVLPCHKDGHMSSCQGIFAAGPCIYWDAGCHFTAENNMEMKTHLTESLLSHTTLHKLWNNKIIEQFPNLTKKFEEESNKIEEISSKAIKPIKKRQTELEQKFQDLSNTFQDFEQQKMIADSHRDDFSVDAIIQPITMRMDDLDLRFQLHENTTFDGHLLWKINRVHERTLEAKSKKVTALHSSPCFTSRYGYKYCLRLYLQGDGMGKDKYLSLFIVIMKSEYDNVLKWPFQKKITFTLINQDQNRKNLVESMLPSADSSSFQKPKKDMNIASGCPRFVEINRLAPDGFLKDDSLFIDVEIK
eukprot:TCONS_00057255-protein